MAATSEMILDIEHFGMPGFGREYEEKTPPKQEKISDIVPGSEDIPKDTPERQHQVLTNDERRILTEVYRDIQTEWRQVAGTERPFIPLTDIQLIEALDKLEQNQQIEENDPARSVLLVREDTSQWVRPLGSGRPMSHRWLNHKEIADLRQQAERGLEEAVAYDMFYSPEALAKQEQGNAFIWYPPEGIPPHVVRAARDKVFSQEITAETAQRYQQENNIRERGNKALTRLMRNE